MNYTAQRESLSRQGDWWGVDKIVSECYDAEELNRDGTAFGRWVRDPRKAVTVIRAGGGADATGKPGRRFAAGGDASDAISQDTSALLAMEAWRVQLCGLPKHCADRRLASLDWGRGVAAGCKARFLFVYSGVIPK